MSASKVNPNTWKGQERDGGYIAKNKKPTSASSPQWRGKLYLPGVGWYWVSAWERDARSGPLLNLRVQEMTDEQAAKFCQPKPESSRGKPQPDQYRHHQNGAEATDTEIPF